jgi:hypothetical protein
MATVKGRLVPDASGGIEEKLPAPSCIVLSEGTLVGRADNDALIYFELLYPTPYAQYNRKVIALVNPDSFSESIEPVYSKRPVIGLSHEILQYIRTASRSIQLELFVSWHIMQQKGYIDISVNPLQWRNRFEAMTLPAGPYYGPPTVRVEWPDAYLDFIGVCTGLDIEYKKFSVTGAPLDYTMKVSFVEVNGASGLMTSPAAYRRGIGRRSTLGL